MRLPGESGYLGSEVTWGDEEGSPQLLVPRDVPDLLGHVDHPAGHGRDPAEVQDPGRRTGKGVLTSVPSSRSHQS